MKKGVFFIPLIAALGPLGILILGSLGFLGFSAIAGFFNTIVLVLLFGGFAFVAFGKTVELAALGRPLAAGIVGCFFILSFVFAIYLISPDLFGSVSLAVSGDTAIKSPSYNSQLFSAVPLEDYNKTPLGVIDYRMLIGLIGAGVILTYYYYKTRR